MSTIGLAIIARDEELRIPELLRSIDGAFDQVVLVDTGSTDRTVQVFRGWAATQKDTEVVVEHFKWTKDFSEARRFAQSLQTTDWQVWADCDDVITGAQNLRRVVLQAPDNVIGYIAGYNYAQHPVNGECLCYLKRERVVRAGRSTWVNRVHEAQVVDGPVMALDPGVAEWVHRKQAYTAAEGLQTDSRRNLEILEKWNGEEPNNSRVLAYLGTENAARGDIKTAIAFYLEYMALNPEWDEERAQVHRKMATCYFMSDQVDAAIETAFEAMRVLPSWTDSYITLAEAYHLKGEHTKAIEWANEALRRGKPDTLLIINPLDYSFQPRKVMAGSLAALGDHDGAIEHGWAALQLQPADEELAQALAHWRAQSKLTHTANSIGMLAQQLMAHDEQLKALKLLEDCVPHFAVDHPGIVQLRSGLRERLAWVDKPSALLDHYATGGSKPEDFLPDDQLDVVAARLPRVEFLMEGIFEQKLLAHIDGRLGEGDGDLPQFFAALGVPDDA